MGADRQPQFVALIQRAQDLLAQTRRLNDMAESAVDLAVGPNGKRPETDAAAPRNPTGMPMTEQIDFYLGSTAAVLEHIDSHVRRLLTELPSVPEGPSIARAVGR